MSVRIYVSLLYLMPSLHALIVYIVALLTHRKCVYSHQRYPKSAHTAPCKGQPIHFYVTIRNPGNTDCHPRCNPTADRPRVPPAAHYNTAPYDRAKSSFPIVIETARFLSPAQGKLRGLMKPGCLPLCGDWSDSRRRRDRAGRGY